jgi:dTMP kinase
MHKNIYPGKFIVLDGLDGAGQSTQAGKLVDYLSEKKQKLKFGHTGVHSTKEPTSGLIGGLIRGQLTHDWKSSQECLQLLFAADRARHLGKEILPLLERGVIVICDRYFFSSFAFGALDLKQNWLFQINQNFLLPDITFFLKVSPKICAERIKRNRYEITLFEKEEIAIKVWKNYQKLNKKFKNVYIINGEKPVDKVFEQIKTIIDRKL